MKQDILDEMSGDYSRSNQETTTADDVAAHLPAYLAYLSLLFKVIFTVGIILMAGWIIVAIQVTKCLHKIHNIFIGHLMAVDILRSCTDKLIA